MFLIIGMDKLGLKNRITFYLDSIAMSILFLMAGTAFSLQINLVEADPFISPMFINFLKKRSLSQFVEFVQFYVPPTLRTRARLCVVLETLSQNRNIRTINKRMPLFKEAISIYTNYLRKKFDFDLCEPEKFYRYVKLAAYTKETMIMDDVRKGLEAFIELMEREDEDPFEVVKLLKGMMKESTSMKDIFDEIDVEPKRIRRWLSVHSNLTRGIIALISLVVTVVVAIIK